MANEFAARTSVEQVEEGADLAPKFDADGLIPAVTTTAGTGELLMVGYMNAEALKRTIETGEAHYWSRSRQVLWHKGATSGLVQKVVELMIDDDQDCVWLQGRGGRRRELPRRLPHVLLPPHPARQRGRRRSSSPRKRRCSTRKSCTATRRTRRSSEPSPLGNPAETDAVTGRRLPCSFACESRCTSLVRSTSHEGCRKTPTRARASETKRKIHRVVIDPSCAMRTMRTRQGQVPHA